MERRGWPPYCVVLQAVRRSQRATQPPPIGLMYSAFWGRQKGGQTGGRGACQMPPKWRMPDA
eukprot:15444599-Alexandrium_andersonii.AAC.1